MTYATLDPETGLLTVSLPGAVWYDTLDPLASGMEAALGLPPVASRRVGSGVRFTYEAVEPRVARELADYIYDRGESLLGQDDDDRAARDALRGAIRVARDVYEVLGAR